MFDFLHGIKLQQKSMSKNSGLQGCDSVLSSSCLSTFRRKVAFETSVNPSTATQCHIPEDLSNTDVETSGLSQKYQTSIQ